MQLNSSLIKKYFPTLNDHNFIYELLECAELHFVKKGEVLINSGAYGKFIPLIIDGYVKVSRSEKEGEVFLYYLEKGQTCTMTLQCCNSESPSSVRATAESEVLLLKIPAFKMNEWFKHFSVWQNFVLDTYQARFNVLLESVDQLVFNDLEGRLRNNLCQRAKHNKSNMLYLTHQELAVDLNTSREVISRLLKKLENMKILKLGRNRVEILQ